MPVNRTGIEYNLQHLNNNVLCAVAIKTDGPIPRSNSIVRICVMPLNSHYEPSKNVMAFSMWMKPRRATTETKGITRDDFMTALKARDPYDVAFHFSNWRKQLLLPRNHRIMPLAYDWPTVRQFLEDWLDDEFADVFDPRYRDLLPATIYMADRADTHGVTVPIPKYGETYIFSQCNATMPHKDLIQECLSLAKSYKELQRIYIGA